MLQSMRLIFNQVITKFLHRLPTSLLPVEQLSSASLECARGATKRWEQGGRGSKKSGRTKRHHATFFTGRVVPRFEFDEGTTE